MKYITIHLCNKIAHITIHNTLCHKINYRTTANTTLCEHELSIYNTDSICDVNNCIADVSSHAVTGIITIFRSYADTVMYTMRYSTTV